MKLNINKPDTLGAIASTLCMIHCMATPLLFIVHSCSLHGCANTPNWWKGIDFLFLTISFFAVYQVTQNSTHKLLTTSFWASWVLLSTVVINEYVRLLFLPELFKYVAASSLVLLHIYNLNFCKCKEDACCTTIDKK